MSCCPWLHYLEMLLLIVLRKKNENCQEINLIEFKVHARAIYDPLLFEVLRAWWAPSALWCSLMSSDQRTNIIFYQVHLASNWKFPTCHSDSRHFKFCPQKIDCRAAWPRQLQMFSVSVVKFWFFDEGFDWILIGLIWANIFLNWMEYIFG